MSGVGEGVGPFVPFRLNGARNIGVRAPSPTRTSQ